MLNKVLRAKLLEYAPANTVEQENVLQELLQHCSRPIPSARFCPWTCPSNGIKTERSASSWKSTPARPWVRISRPVTLRFL